MTAFAATAMTSLVDVPVRYDLAESTTPAVRLDELADPAEVARLRLGYGTSQGEADLRGLIAAGTGVEPDQVLITNGAMGALFLLAQALCRPGDHVLLPTPCFPPARTVPEGFGARIDPLPLSFDEGYRLPLDRFAAALTSRTRLVSLASPQNPSGVRLTDEELRGVLAAVDEHSPDATVLIDETYRESTYDTAPAPSSAAALSPRIVTCASLSKAHGAPGLRIGWLTSTDPERYDQLRTAKFLTTVACGTLDEYLARQALRRGTELLAARADRLRQALAELTRWADDHPVELCTPDGGAICCLRLPAGLTDADIAKFYASLADHQVRVAPGSWFGEHDRVFRVSFGHLPPAEFTAALDRLAAALDG
jgi:aspartate/methionine/tyrosine aminotransferase